MAESGQRIEMRDRTGTKKKIKIKYSGGQGRCTYFMLVFPSRGPFFGGYNITYIVTFGVFHPFGGALV